MSPPSLADLSSLINTNTTSTSQASGGVGGAGDDQATSATAASQRLSDVQAAINNLSPLDPSDPQEVATLVMMQQSILSAIKDVEAQVVVAPPEANPLTGVVALNPAEEAEKRKIEAQGNALRQEAVSYTHLTLPTICSV